MESNDEADGRGLAQAHRTRLELRAGQPGDLARVVGVHRAAFPGYFLTRLGPMFLRTYYRHVLNDPDGVLLVAEADGRVVAFVAGFANPTAFYRRMRAQRVRFGLATLAGLLRSPALLGRIVVNIGRVHGRTVADRGSDEAELASIAVHPDCRGSGLGRELCLAFSGEMFERGMAGVYLTTDADDNDAVNRLYLKLGFRVRSTFEAAGRRRMHEYVLARADRGSAGGRGDG